MGVGKALAPRACGHKIRRHRPRLSFADGAYVVGQGVHDVQNGESVVKTAAKRWPGCRLMPLDVRVQGEGAASRIARALAAASARAECDVLLLVRGGGSIEDLWQFNEEAVARAIRASAIPVVVGVGHETDFTIADFAADERAPTPTAAAERVSPSREALLSRIADLALGVSREMSRRLSYGMQSVDGLQRRLVHPAERLRNSGQHLQHLVARLSGAMKLELAGLLAQVKHARAGLAAFDHPALLARGYSVTRNEKGEIDLPGELQAFLFEMMQEVYVRTAEDKEGVPTRGLTLDGVLWVDEAGYVPRAAWDAARLTQAAVQDPRVIVTGTPSGVGAWLVLCCRAMQVGAQEALSIAESVADRTRK